MNYQVAIKRLADGEVRIYEVGPDIEWGEHSQFWWGPLGNMGCARQYCNLHTSFERAAGVEPDFPDLGYCNGPDLYAVDHFLVDGKRVEPEGA